MTAATAGTAGAVVVAGIAATAGAITGSNMDPSKWSQTHLAFTAMVKHFRNITQAVSKLSKAFLKSLVDEDIAAKVDLGNKRF